MSDKNGTLLEGAVLDNPEDAKVELPWEATVSVLYVDLLVNTIESMANQLISVQAPHCLPTFAQALTVLRKLRVRILEVEQRRLVIAQPGDVPPAR